MSVARALARNSPPADPEIKSRFGSLWWRDIDLQQRPTGIIKGLLGESEMSVIFGESGCGKSFLALELALHVALGWEWRGHRVQQRTVVYVAAEGGGGMKKRVVAFREHYELSATEMVPLLLIPSSVDLRNPDADTDPLMAEIRAEMAKLRLAGEDLPPVGLSVIDTLSRALAGGNENGPDDMGALVRNVDRIRGEMETHVALVHHTGKEIGKGARGHSLLRAAADTEIEVRRDEASGTVTATVTKQKDGETGAEFAFRLDQVRLGQDEDGDVLTSCVCHHLDGEEVPVRAEKSKLRLTPAAKVVLEMLKKAVEAEGRELPASNHTPRGVLGVPVEVWRAYAYQGAISDGGTQGARQKAFKRATDALQAAGAVGVWGEWAWLT